MVAFQVNARPLLLGYVPLSSLEPLAFAIPRQADVRASTFSMTSHDSEIVVMLVVDSARIPN